LSTVGSHRKKNWATAWHWRAWWKRETAPAFSINSGVEEEKITWTRIILEKEEKKGLVPLRNVCRGGNGGGEGGGLNWRGARWKVGKKRVLNPVFGEGGQTFYKEKSVFLFQPEGRVNLHLPTLRWGKTLPSSSPSEWGEEESLLAP